MNIFKHRPLALTCAVFLAALAFTFYQPIPAKVAVAATAGAILLVVAILHFLLPKRLKWRPSKKFAVRFAATMFAVIFATGLGFVTYNVNAQRQIDLADLIGPPITVTGHIVDVVHMTSWGSISIVQITEVEGVRHRFQTLMHTSVPLDIGNFESFTAEMVFSELENLPNRFPQRTFYGSQGIFTQAQLLSPLPYRGEPARNAGWMLYRMNAYLDDNLMMNLSPAGYSFTSVKVLGNRSNMDDALSRDFRTLGMAHMIAISGMHLSILVGGFDFLFRRLYMPKVFRTATLLALCVIYMGLCGFSPSVTRAGIMFLIFYAAEFFRREPDGITSLFFAVALICLVQPFSIFSPGLLMSMFATLGIMTLGTKWSNAALERFQGKSKIIGTTLASLSVTVGATLFIIPPMSLYFSAFSVAGLVANFIFVPLTSIALFAAPILMLPPVPIPIITGMVANFVDRTTELIHFTASSARYLQWTVISLEYPFVPIFMLLLAICLCVLLVTSIKKRRYKIAPAAALLCSFALAIFVYNVNMPTAQVIIVNDRNNDAIIMHSSGRVALVDISDGSRGVMNTGRNISARHTHRGIDTYILTHLHQRHVGLLWWLANNYYLDYLVLPEPVTTADHNIYGSLVETAERLGISVITMPHYGQSVAIYFGDLRFEKMPHAMISRSAHPVIALNIAFGTQRIFYLGGSSIEVSEDFVATAYSANAVILGVHGPSIREDTPGRLFNPRSFAVFANEDVHRRFDGSFVSYRVLTPTQNYERFVFE
ncbi:MAG: ComEC/Rec2 family competence protein [Oscillospiraceae bacterium]|nr:ComEC/Rec2 family competence protein [Oscillospiraceae bacterium]